MGGGEQKWVATAFTCQKERVRKVGYFLFLAASFNFHLQDHTKSNRYFQDKQPDKATLSMQAKVRHQHQSSCCYRPFLSIRIQGFDDSRGFVLTGFFGRTETATIMDPMGTQKGVATQQAQRAATPMPINAQSMHKCEYQQL